VRINAARIGVLTGVADGLLRSAIIDLGERLKAKTHALAS
jgi:hypothetical protein